MSKDPIGLFGGLNNSTYVSDPNQWVDPLGLQFQEANNKYAHSNGANAALREYEKRNNDNS